MTMAQTYTEQSETRLYFDFERDGETKSRYIALPGVPAENSERRTTVINNFNTFRTQLIDNGDGSVGILENFVQPADWRDSTGSSGGTDNPWTTKDVQLEFYVVQKTRFDGQS